LVQRERYANKRLNEPYFGETTRAARPIDPQNHDDVTAVVRAEHFVKYACACYGWPYYVYHDPGA
jgi:hypothetical protein